MAIVFVKTSRSMVTLASCWRSLRALSPVLTVARKGIVTLLFELALPFGQQAFSDAERLGDMTKRRAGKHLVDALRV